MSRPPSPTLDTAPSPEHTPNDNHNSDPNPTLPADSLSNQKFTTPSNPETASGAALLTQLQQAQTLLQTQSTRLSQLSDLETETSHLRDQLTFLTAAKDVVEKQLVEERSKREAAEENVELLRGQVEQARRGVGILQKQEKERKRLSVMPGLGLAGGGLGLVDTEGEEVLTPIAGGGGGGGADVKDKERDREREGKLQKRSSILVRGHRRISSQSEPDIHLVTSPNPNNTGGFPTKGGLRELRLGAAGSTTTTGTSPQQVTSPVPSISQPSFFDEPVPVPTTFQRSSSGSGHPPISPEKSTTATQAQAQSQEENLKLRNEIAGLQTRLARAEEARVASEECLKALREFMATPGNEGETAEDAMKGIRLPPLPTETDDDDHDHTHDGHLSPAPTPAVSGPSGWGFKLWKQQPQTQTGLLQPTSPSLSTTVEPPITPAGLGSLSPSSQSVRSGNTPLPAITPGEGTSTSTTEGNVSQVEGGMTPLGKFVGGWSRGVVPGTPVERPKAEGRSLSSFFSRKKEDNKEKEKVLVDKELPPPPPLEETEEVGREGGLEPPVEIGGVGGVDEGNAGNTIDLGTPREGLKSVLLDEDHGAETRELKVTEERIEDGVETGQAL